MWKLSREENTLNFDIHCAELLRHYEFFLLVYEKEAINLFSIFHLSLNSEN